MRFKSLALGVALLVATPVFAQATGPQGLAEVTAPKAKPAKAPKNKGKVAKMKQGKFDATKAVVTAAPPATPDNIMNIELSSGGTVSVLLRPDKAPLAVERLKVLSGRHFYDGLTFHRVIEGFMAQGGDPKGDGSGGSDLPDLKAEFSDLPHVRGVMAMARAAGEDSANSQFYIMLSPTLNLDNHYTIVGRVIAGMANADNIEKGEPPANPTKIVRTYFGAAPADPNLPAPAAAVSNAAKINAPTTLSSKPAK